MPLASDAFLLTSLEWLDLQPAAVQAHLCRVGQTAAGWWLLYENEAPLTVLQTWLTKGVTSLIHGALNTERLELALSSPPHLSGTVLWFGSVGAKTADATDQLTRWGLTLICCSGLTSALHHLSASGIDLLCLAANPDPDISLEQLVALLRQSPVYAALPILVLPEVLSAAEGSRVAPGVAFAAGPVSNWRFPLQALLESSRPKRFLAMGHDAEPPLSLQRLEHLRVALDHHAIVSITDTEGGITYVNDRFCEVSGYRREELLGVNHRLLKSGAHSEAFYQSMWDTIGSGEVWHGELCNRRKDGQSRWFDATIYPSLDDLGEPLEYISIRTDVTTLKQAQETAQISDERYRRAQEFSNIGTWDWNVVSGEVVWSEHTAALYGRTLEELDPSFSGFLSTVYPEDRDRVVAAVRATVDKDVPYEIEHRVQEHDGTVRWVLECGAMLRDAQGHALHMLGVVQDIDTRKRAELALENSERLLQEAQRLAQLGSWEINLLSDTLHCAPEVYRIFGQDSAAVELTRNSFRQAVHPDDWPRVEACEQEAASTGSYEITHRVIRPDGSIRHVHEIARLERDEQGMAIRMVGTVQDVTDRVDAEVRLHDSQQRFAAAVEGAGDGVWDWHLASGKLEMIGNYEAMLGYPKGGLPPRIESWSDNLHPDDRERVTGFLQRYLRGEEAAYHQEVRLRCRNGHYKWILCRGSVVERDKEGQPTRMIGIHTDIDERKAKDESLALFQRLFLASEQAVGIADGQGYLLYQNPAHARLLGYDNDAMRGLHFSRFLMDDERDSRLEQFWRHAASGESWVGLLPLRRRDGSQFISASNLGFLNDEHGELRYIFNIFSDFSAELERREELAKAREVAEKANHAKSDFLSSMSHELRTPMNAILGFAQILEFDGELTQDQHDSVHEILKAGQHLLDLINEVLDLAKIESGRIDLSLEPLRLAPILAECRQLLAPLALQRDIQMRLDVPAGLTVRADRTRMKQVLLNLLSNAIKYNRVSGEVWIDVIRLQDDWRVVISDTGLGFEDTSLDALFEPFNRLGAEGSGIEGTGIGLSITRRLVELMGGAIGVESDLGRGSRFWIELPAVIDVDIGQSDAASSPPTDVCVAVGSDWVVLCIDDNPSNLKLIAHILGRRALVTLLTAHTPDLGLELALGHRPDLILLDINMPGMDGYQMLEIFKQEALLSDIPVIAVTANAMPRDIERGMAAGFDQYLTKPLDVKAFLAMMDQYQGQWRGQNP